MIDVPLWTHLLALIRLEEKGALHTKTLLLAGRRVTASRMAGRTGLEPATSGLTGRHSKPTELPPRTHTIKSARHLLRADLD